MNENNFNIEPLVFEIENIIKKGVNTILKDYMNRYDLLEKTHSQIMRLPSVLNELNKNDYSESDEEDDKSAFVSIKDMTHTLVCAEIGNVEKKMEKKFNSLVPILDKILGKIQTLSETVKELQDNKNNKIYTDVKDFIENKNKLLIVKKSENENIKLNIVIDDEEENTPYPSDDEKVIEEEIKEVIVEKETDKVFEETAEEETAAEEESVEEEESVVEETEEKKDKDEVVKDKESVVEESVVEESVVEESDEEASIETETKEEEPEEDINNHETKEEEEEELTIITIDDLDYCTNNEETGFIYELNEEGEQGDKIGYLKDGEPFFYADEN